MQNDLASVALQLQERIIASPLYKMWTTYLSQSGLIVATAMFKDSNTMETVLGLEMRVTLGIISDREYESLFPSVPYLTTSMGYKPSFLCADRPVVARGVAPAIVGNGALTEISIEMCYGPGYVEDQKRSDLLLSLSVSPNGTVDEVVQGLGVKKLHQTVVAGEEALKAFGKLEAYILTNSGA